MTPGEAGTLLKGWVVKLGKVLGDGGGLLTKVRGHLTSGVQQNFDSESAPDGTPWAPPARNYGHPPLRDNLDLYSAAMNATQQAQMAATSPFEVTVTAVVDSPDHAMWQQFGTGHVPARPFFGVPDDTADAIAADVGDAAEAVFTVTRP